MKRYQLEPPKRESFATTFAMDSMNSAYAQAMNRIAAKQKAEQAWTKAGFEVINQINIRGKRKIELEKQITTASDFQKKSLEISLLKCKVDNAKFLVSCSKNNALGPLKNTYCPQGDKELEGTDYYIEHTAGHNDCKVDLLGD